MARRVDYLCSDFDQRAHRGAITLDLQAIDMADASLDVVLSAHVLEHVPDTDRALSELHRVVRPGGHLFLQVPLLQGRTAPPDEPEYHGDQTLVYWRFGWDLTARIREHGFACTALVTHDLYRRATGGGATWTSVSPEFDAEEILRMVRPDDLTAVATDRVARRARFEPSYMFVTWHAAKPG
jgi:SAM-dependent methyltransferase